MGPGDWVNLALETVLDRLGVRVVHPDANPDAAAPAVLPGARELMDLLDMKVRFTTSRWIVGKF